MIDETEGKMKYFQILFPILFVNLTSRAHRMDSSTMAQLVDNGFTSLATSYSDQFKACIVQVNEKERIQLQSVMRYIIQQQQQQQQAQNGTTSGHDSLRNPAGTSASYTEY